MNPGADRLPGEVLEKIFSYLPCEDLVESVQFVCTWWQHVSREKSLWKHIVYKPNVENEKIIQMLKISPQLRNLNVQYASIDSNLIQFITESCPNLEHLYISWDSIDDNSGVTITRPLSQIKILTLSCCTDDYSLDFPYLDSAFPNLESLNIGDLRFNRKDIEHYLEKKQDSLHTLGLSCFTEDKLCVLPCLSECTKVRNLTLCEVSDKVRSWKEVGYLPGISHLTLSDSDMRDVNESSSVFCSFPNITTLVLDCCDTSETFFCTIARNCPLLQKLRLYFYGTLYEDKALLIKHTLHALPLERLTHLYIHKSEFLTDEGIEHILRLMPQLIYLDLYECKQVTTGCLNLICGISKLEVLKFDLQNQPPPADLRASDVKNKNLQLMFYKCRDVSYLDALRQQHLRVCLTRYSNCRTDRFLSQNKTGYFRHCCCLWCTN